MRKQAVTAITMASFMMATNVAQAAMVYPITGQILINQGSGFREISKATELKQGDNIMANPGGIAKLSYSDGCSINIKAGAVATAQAQSPCALQNGQITEGGMVQTQTTAGGWATATTGSGGTGAGAGAGAGAAAGAAAAGAAVGGLSAAAIAGIAVAAAAAVAVGTAAAGGGDDKKAAPASP